MGSFLIDTGHQMLFGW